MAQDDQVVEEEVKPQGSKKLIIIIVLFALVLAAGGAAAYFLMSGGDKPDKRAARDREHKEEPVKTILIPFEEKFTVNLRSDDGAPHYLQIPQMHLEVGDAEIAARIEEIKPKIGDRISSLLRSKDMAAMQAPGSDVKLKGEMKSVVNEALGVRDDKKGVREVILPQSFIVQ